MFERYSSPAPENRPDEFMNHDTKEIEVIRRKLRPYNLSFDFLDLNQTDIPGMRVAVLNTMYTGTDRLRFAKYYQIMGHPFEEPSVSTDKAKAFFIPVKHFYVDDNFNINTAVDSDTFPIINSPLYYWGITKSPRSNMYYAHAYAVPYSAVQLEPEMLKYDDQDPLD